MRRRAALVLSFALFAGSAARAAPEQPMVLVHTGYLLDAGDQPVTATGLAMTFRLFTLSASVSGETALWEGSCAVEVAQGHYAAALGKDCGTGLMPSMLPTGEERYLEVTIGGTTLAPRMLIGTVPTAAVATNALALSGQSLDDLDVRYAKLQAAPMTPQAGGLSLDGALEAASINSAGDATIGGALGATSITTSGDATIGGALGATSITSSGDATIGGALGATSITTSGDATIGGALGATSITTSGDATIGGALTATSFAGNGARVTNLDAAQLATGIIPDGRLAGTQSAAVTLTNGANQFAGGFNGRFTGDGSALTGLDAASVTTGTIADARLGTNVARLDADEVFSGHDSFAKPLAIGVASPADWATLDVGGPIRGEIPSASSFKLGSGCTHAERNSWVAGTVSVTVPENGRYLVQAACRLYTSSLTSPADNWWKCRVQNTTANTTTLAIFGAGANTGDGASSGDQTVSASTIVPLAKGDALTTQYWLTGNGSTTYCLDGDANGGVGLTLVRVGN